MYKFSFYVPESHLNEVKEALFKAGAGSFGNYESVCWQVKGQGQFCPKQNSRPFIGSLGRIESVLEYKVEMLCKDLNVEGAIKALRLVHPYEEPAFDVVKLYKWR